MVGVDFKGKTNSALARPPSLERVTGICLEGVEASSSTSSVEAMDWEVSTYTPKAPLQNL